MCMLLALCKLPRSGYWNSSHFFTHLILLKVDCRHRISHLYNTRWGTINTCYVNYRVAVGLLVGQGWERKRPTLPRLRREKTRP